MPSSCTLGPILGVETEDLYTICFVTPATVDKAEIEIDQQLIEAKRVASLPCGDFCRAEYPCSIQEAGRWVSYTLRVDGASVKGKDNKVSRSFYVPGKDEKPRMAYASCNGFSSYQLLNSTEHPYAMWQKMAGEHRASPLSLLIMGGDQVYADAIWSSVPTLAAWNELGRKEKVKRKPTKVMRQQIERFYSELYCRRWSQIDIAVMLACVPSVMMWDDHDIFDGWGSYPADLQECPVYQYIYQAAAKYFEWFQLRSLHNQALLCQQDSKSHYAWGLRFRGNDVLAMDHRSQRLRHQVMASSQWQDIIAYLDSHQQHCDLLVLSAVPVVYRDFSLSERAVDFTPWEEEITDDLKDHWRAKEHQSERSRLIMRLLDNGREREGRTVIFSGDVHVGCLGVVCDTRYEPAVSVHQVVSSGVVHPSPTYIQWLGIQAITNDNTEYLDENGAVRISMLKPHGSDKYLRTRNFVTIEEGTDNKLWINWVCENNDKPVYPLV